MSIRKLNGVGKSDVFNPRRLPGDRGNNTTRARIGIVVNLEANVGEAPDMPFSEKTLLSPEEKPPEASRLFEILDLPRHCHSDSAGIKAKRDHHFGIIRWGIIAFVQSLGLRRRVKFRIDLHTPQTDQG